MLAESWLTALLAAAIPCVAARPDPDLWRRAMTVAGDTKACGLSDPAPTVKAPKTNPWAPISPEDAAAVWDYVHSPDVGLNLTAPANATQTDNYVYFVETLQTNKSQVLPYIDGDRPIPDKYARVVIFEGGKEVPVSQEYMVGPLPIDSKTSIQKLDYIFNGGSGGAVPYNARYYDGKRSAASEPLLKSIMAEIADITLELFDGVYYGSGDNRTNITPGSPTPVSFDGTQAYRNIMFRYPGLATYLAPIDLFVLLDVTGTDASKYFLKGIVTNSRFFPTVADLRKAYEAGELKSEFPQTRNTDWGLLNYKPEMGVRDLEDRLAPQSIELGGKRYKLDTEQQYVEFMGWSFYMSFSRTLGIQFFDIRFKGERVLYELSLQEAAAQYAGYQPKAANTALCIFEADSGYPLARHRTGASNDYGFSRLASVKGSALHTRAVATVGNYDYLFDYAFHVDGSLEITVRASGYLQSSPYYKNQSRFGPRIQQGTQGSYHDHILTFKADFDIVDTQNSLQVTELVTVNQTQPWYPELGSFAQMELNTTLMQTEQQFNWAPNGQAMYSVISSNLTNAWGEKRGYRLIPGRSNIHLSVHDSPWSRKQSTFLKSSLAVTRQHDAEVFANSWQNINLPEAPQHDFAKFFDGEGVDDEDLVVWFNLGMHHFTRAEDIPVTLYTEAVSSIVFAPQNFNDRAQEGDLRNRRWIATDAKTGKLEYEDYGIALPTCKVELEEPTLKISEWTTV
ncbi:copper amine oxidase [Cercophora scortea]|uniref:Amine oxidase n=1 Tax=Cercophora scortea TaxID=314031 RepID=A0AAE0I2F2_9PEZI|nr:copper amine oxidase [Cercophora scortea]